MWKIKSILISLLAIATLANCSDDNDNIPGGGDEKNADVAYMSISLAVPTAPRTRALGSGEETATPAENAINTLYVVTFDGSGQVVKDADATTYVTILYAAALEDVSGNIAPKTPIKVSTDTKQLLVVANPGAVLADRLSKLGSSATYTDIIAKLEIPVTPATPKTIVDEVAHAGGCTMINVGFYDMVDDNWKADCLLNVADKIVLASAYKTDVEAQNAAKSKPAILEIERLATKLEVTALDDDALAVGPFEASTQASLGQFRFGEWTVDYYNSHMFPYAVKTKTNSSPAHVGNFYDNNFYTKDPNYDESGTGYLDGIIKNQVVNLEPKADWTGKGTYKYSTENTMAADYQKFGAATRLVIKAQYIPEKESEGNYTLGNDWFCFSNGANSLNFPTFAALMTAYEAAENKAVDQRTSNEKLLLEACDEFHTQVKPHLTTGTTTGFKDLTQTILDEVAANGGELSKVDGCIYWYQKSINYYYYEIRHDNTVTDHMAFGKYGVVRNNYYLLNLTKVNGKGTPWYPGGGPEDPDDKEDIDKLGAYLHFEIKVAPWIKWATDFEI